MVLLLFDNVIYVFLLLWLCILVCLCMTTLTEVFPCFFPSCKANARAKLAKTRHGPHSSTLVVICVVLCVVCKCVLPPGDNPIAVNKYHISKERTFRNNPVGHKTSVTNEHSWTACPLMMGLTGCPGTSVTTHQSTPNNTPEESRPHLHLKSSVWSQT